MNKSSRKSQTTAPVGSEIYMPENEMTMKCLASIMSHSWETSGFHGFRVCS